MTTYEALAKTLIWKLKFDRASVAADSIGRHLAELYGDKLSGDVLIVPMPTAMSRVRLRGYDQAVLIAQSFARHAKLEYAPLLRRVGKQEQKGAGRRQRQTQLRGVFSVKNHERVVNRRILLIDDAVTTGATLDEAADVLVASGARIVGALVFAYA